MIGWLKGIVRQQFPSLILDVNGVGYLVNVGPASLAKLSIGSTQELIIHTHVREDALELFGFLTQEDKKLFLLLLSVSGVGPKVALATLDAGSVAQLTKAVQAGDVGYFTAVPRVGKKLAQKIIIELKTKLGSQTDLDLADGSSEQQELIMALEGLGYSTQEISRVLPQLPNPLPEVTTSLKLALKLLR
jgi:Holliday junction DNA helicase RuvA